MITSDVAVIGAGPTGLFAIFELGMLKIKSVVIDALDFVGGQCSALYPEKPIYDIPAHPKIAAQDLIENLKAQAEPFNPQYLFNQQVVNVVKEGEWFTLTTSKNTIVKVKAIIIAGGCGSFGPNRPPLQNIESYEKSSVFYMINKRDIFKDKKVVIAGGGDSAVDWALNLADIAEKIYVVHRRPKFRCAPESADQMYNIAKLSGRIEMVIPYQLDGLLGDNGQLSHVVVKDLEGNTKNLEADYLLPFFGLAMELGPIRDWGLNINKTHIEVVQNTMSTNVPGIYAIGDIAHYPGKLKLILTGFAEAAHAAYDIYNIIFPNQALHFEYSTTKGVAAS
ncbi:NAD(P)/FAD-dependent oxidoreductase [Rickettsiales endosymbiont of Stachyamoeba lipophora]|uniref:NAD(P)/FAD-dependent oxidoreductase n=1 Tax=Rickettsiales endosymbiont of Stachyamoeba lipophora TaxID=2486578 RepID=UPI000F6466DF|nr:NAD(P)/FAD-dependent oxidoreductase [Rickettsiales endosymbiont of Stachyamoeba lipophora]AZL16441.1 NAD(P)/FAD-dependent oxidoreductase [Rickettsiales endosymbiont of Stachyamoeba lipophora]